MVNVMFDLVWLPKFLTFENFNQIIWVQNVKLFKNKIKS